MTQEQAGRSKQKTGGQMTIKRSVSPDGRIDSMSVEVTSSLVGLTLDGLVEKAEAMIEAESRIADAFVVSRTGNGHANGAATNGHDAARPARMVEIGGMETKFGRRLFIVFNVDGESIRMFGSKKQLARAASLAGSPRDEGEIEEGLELGIVCQVVTGRSRDGQFSTVEKVLHP